MADDERRQATTTENPRFQAISNWAYVAMAGGDERRRAMTTGISSHWQLTLGTEGEYTVRYGLLHETVVK